MKLIEVKGLQKSYGDVHAVRGVDLPRGFPTLEMTILKPRLRTARNCSGHRSGFGIRATNVVCHEHGTRVT